MNTIYLDNNATTKVAEEVFEEIKPYFSKLYGNPSSMHTFGGQVGNKIRRAREQVAALLGVDPSEIIFTGCGTESDNTAKAILWLFLGLSLVIHYSILITPSSTSPLEGED